MAWDERLNHTAVLLFIGVLSSQIGKGWKVRGEATTLSRPEDNVTGSPSLSSYLSSVSAPSSSVSSQHNPPTPSWHYLLTESAPYKTYSPVSKPTHTNLKSSVNSSHLSSTIVAAAAAAVAVPEATSSPLNIEQNLLHDKKTEEIKSHIGSRSSVKAPTPPNLKASGDREGHIAAKEQRGKNGFTLNGDEVRLKDQPPSSLQRGKSSSFKSHAFSRKGVHKGGTKTGSRPTELSTVRTDPLTELTTSPTINHTNATSDSVLLFNLSATDHFTSSTEEEDEEEEEEGAQEGEEEEEDSEVGTELVVPLDKHTDDQLKQGPDIGSSSPASELLATSGNGSHRRPDTAGNHGRSPAAEEDVQQPPDAAYLGLNLTEADEWRRTNSALSSEVPHANSSSLAEELLLTDGIVDTTLNSSSLSSNWTLDDEDYDGDEEDNGSHRGEDYDEDSDEDTDWYYNVDDDGQDYYDDDYEYETRDDAVEDMRPGGDNYYRGAKISDEEWIRERSKMDMNEIASHPGQEVFVGPHTFEAEFGPISEVRSETMEMHQPFVPESSHDASLSILVFYTWIGIVTVMVIGAFIALKHRHRIANYVWDARTGYRKKGTVCATEEGRNLLTTVM